MKKAQDWCTRTTNIDVQQYVTEIKSDDVIPIQEIEGQTSLSKTIEEETSLVDYVKA